MKSDVQLGFVGFGRFLGTQPHWNGTKERPPTALEAAIEQASPLSHGLPIGVRGHLDVAIAAGYNPQAGNHGGVDGYTVKDPYFTYLLHCRQMGARAVTAAREKLQRNSAQFKDGDRNKGWRTQYQELDQHGWSILLDSIYAAHIVYYATEHTPPSMVDVATVALYGGCRYVACKLEGSTATSAIQPRQAQVIEDLFTAAAAFQLTLP